MVRSGRFTGVGVGALLSVFAASASAQTWLDDTPRAKTPPQIHVFDSLPDCEDTLAELGVQGECLNLFANAVTAAPSFDALEKCKEAYQL